MLTRDDLLKAIGQLCEYSLNEPDEVKKAQLLQQLDAAVEAYVNGAYDRGPPTQGGDNG